MTMKPRPTEANARSALIAGWLSKFNDIYDTYGKSLEKRPAIFGEFEEALDDVQVEQLQEAFQEWRRIGTHFPSPGHIRGIITKRRDAEAQYAAEEAWHEIRWRLTFFSWDPENGYLPLFVGSECKVTDRVARATTKKPYNGGFLLIPNPLTARVCHAIEAVGGLRRIAELPAGSGYDFCFRAFLEAYSHHPEVQRIQLGKAEAAQLMDGLRKELE